MAKSPVQSLVTPWISLAIDSHGLDEMDKRILSTMAKNYQGGPVGLGTIAVGVGEEEHTLEEVHEPFLIQEGYATNGPRSRSYFQRLGSFWFQGWSIIPFRPDGTKGRASSRREKVPK